MNDWSQLAMKIGEKAGVGLRPAAAESVEALHKLHVPAEAVAFFQDHEPAAFAEIEDVRLWPIKEIVAENSDYAPGCYVVEYGYIVFATTVFGDAYCFEASAVDSIQAPVVLIAHDAFDWDLVNAEQVARLKKPIAPDFKSFLQSYLDGSLDIQPNYEPFP